MDDYDPNLEAFNIVKDDRVVVVGRIDADKGQKRSIEAASVYVKNIGKAFFASPDDDEEAVVDLRKATLEGTQLVSAGKVTSLTKNALVLNTGYQLLTVSTQGIGRDSTDDPVPAEIRKLMIGDQIRIFGALTDGFMDSDKLIASKVEKIK
ncbi:DNA mismatch repair protein MutH [Akkermansiaceae bacterium]|nr:DNA mismatch repair protein MutH [Akkermansiaceae bacterium]